MSAYALLSIRHYALLLRRYFATLFATLISPRRHAAPPITFRHASFRHFTPQLRCASDATRDDADDMPAPPCAMLLLVAAR